jgi:hypothetical protein
MFEKCLNETHYFAQLIYTNKKEKDMKEATT